MRFSGTIRGLALKLGYAVTMGVSSNFAWFGGFYFKTSFFTIFQKISGGQVLSWVLVFLCRYIARYFIMLYTIVKYS